MKFIKIKRLAVCSMFMLTFSGPMAVQAENELTVSEGKEVSIEFILTLDDEHRIIDSNVGAEPLSFVYGADQIFPGLEKALTGMKAGDKMLVTLEPEQAYGAIEQRSIVEVKKEDIPQESLKVGAPLQSLDAEGQIINVRVTEIKEHTVVLDANHPLAGRTLHFDVKVVDVKEAPIKTN
ncbi:MAG: FKBP-type peptidyl-prolyl cis-trans isomerase [Mariprofundaceae bacterium]